MKDLAQIPDSLYSGYFKIPKEYHQDKIRYYERYARQIERLPEAAHFTISLDYARSLFKVKAYYQFLNIVPLLIEEVIDSNVVGDDWKANYTELLRKKAVAHYYCIEYDEADKVLKDLLLMDPSSETQRIFFRNKRDLLKFNAQRARAWVIMLLFISGLTIAVEMLLVRTFFTEQVWWVELFRNATFMTAILLFIGQELYISYRSRKSLKDVMKTK